MALTISPFSLCGEYRQPIGAILMSASRPSLQGPMRIFVGADPHHVRAINRAHSAAHPSLGVLRHREFVIERQGSSGRQQAGNPANVAARETPLSQLFHRCVRQTHPKTSLIKLALPAEAACPRPPPVLPGAFRTHLREPAIDGVHYMHPDLPGSYCRAGARFSTPARTARSRR